MTENLIEIILKNNPAIIKHFEEALDNVLSALINQIADKHNQYRGETIVLIKGMKDTIDFSRVYTKPYQERKFKESLERHITNELPIYLHNMGKNNYSLRANQFPGFKHILLNYQDTNKILSRISSLIIHHVNANFNINSLIINNLNEFSTAYCEELIKSENLTKIAADMMKGNFSKEFDKLKKEIIPYIEKEYNMKEFVIQAVHSHFAAPIQEFQSLCPIQDNSKWTINKLVFISGFVLSFLMGGFLVGAYLQNNDNNGSSNSEVLRLRKQNKSLINQRDSLLESTKDIEEIEQKLKKWDSIAKANNSFK